MRIGIVGGSIAGCIAGALLGRAGYDVQVYERSKRGLIGRGGGVATSQPVIDEMRDLDLLDRDFPASFFDTLALGKVAPGHGRYGRRPLICPLDMHCVNWASLWEALRTRVPDARYHRGHKLVAATETDSRVTLRFEGGATDEVDLVLFADGYQSFGRALLFPDLPVTYRGYLVWRGVLPEAEIADMGPHDGHPRLSFKTSPGSYVSYVMPSYEGSQDPGDRVINWACYIPKPEAELAEYMVDRSGAPRSGSIPSGAMREEQEAEYKAFARAELPEYFAEVLNRSENNQIQLIYTNSLPAYRKGRMCLVGDAGMVVQPLTGSGLFKSLSNARDLVDQLAAAPVDEALATWSDQQTRTAHKMHDYGQLLEEVFIWNTLDFATASGEACAEWWTRSVTIPEEFSYFAPGAADLKGAA